MSTEASLKDLEAVLNQEIEGCNHCWHMYRIGEIQVDPCPSRCCECDEVTGEDLWKNASYMEGANAGS